MVNIHAGNDVIINGSINEITYVTKELKPLIENESPETQKEILDLVQQLLDSSKKDETFVQKTLNEIKEKGPKIFESIACKVICALVLKHVI